MACWSSRKSARESKSASRRSHSSARHCHRTLLTFANVIRGEVLPKKKNKQTVLAGYCDLPITSISSSIKRPNKLINLETMCHPQPGTHSKAGNRSPGEESVSARWTLALSGRTPIAYMCASVCGPLITSNALLNYAPSATHTHTHTPWASD